MNTEQSSVAEQAATMEPLAILPPNARLWVMHQTTFDAVYRRLKQGGAPASLSLFAIEVRVNPDMPPNRIAAVDRDGNVLGVIELETVPFAEGARRP